MVLASTSDVLLWHVLVSCKWSSGEGEGSSLFSFIWTPGALRRDEVTVWVNQDSSLKSSSTLRLHHLSTQMGICCWTWTQFPRAAWFHGGSLEPPRHLPLSPPPQHHAFLCEAVFLDFPHPPSGPLQPLLSAPSPPAQPFFTCGSGGSRRRPMGTRNTEC